MNKKLFKNTFCYLSVILFLSSCELIDIINGETVIGTWKVHYQYDGEGEAIIPITLKTDHSFTYPLDDDKGSGVWTVKDNKIELEFSDRMIWKGILNSKKTEIKKGIMIRSGYGNDGGNWDGLKIE